LLKGPAEATVQPAADSAKQVQAQPQLLLKDKAQPVEELQVVVADSGEAKACDPGFDIVKNAELPVLVMRASEAAIADSVKAARTRDGKVEHQIIRSDGETKLNEKFTTWLFPSKVTLMAA
jgi:hypothetical protein